jgi:hypothetical protein
MGAGWVMTCHELRRRGGGGGGYDWCDCLTFRMSSPALWNIMSTLSPAMLPEIK